MGPSAEEVSRSSLGWLKCRRGGGVRVTRPGSGHGPSHSSQSGSFLANHPVVRLP